MSRRIAGWICLAFTFCFAASSICAGQTVANKQQVIRQARAAYYNLTQEGLQEFQCSVNPNWRAILAAQVAQDPSAAAETIGILNQIHFSLRFTPDKVQLTHNDISNQHPEMAKNFKQIFDGMEQMTSGFFDTWKLFMLSPPFPEVEGEYVLESVGGQYRLSYNDGITRVVTTMGRNLAISNMEITEPQFDSAIKPGFTDSPKGFLFTSYEATYNSGKPEEATKLKVQIGYQEVDGLQVLKQLDLSGSYGGSPFAVQLAFSDCSVTIKK